MDPRRTVWITNTNLIPPSLTDMAADPMSPLDPLSYNEFVSPFASQNEASSPANPEISSSKMKVEAGSCLVKKEPDENPFQLRAFSPKVKSELARLPRGADVGFDPSLMRRFEKSTRPSDGQEAPLEHQRHTPAFFGRDKNGHRARVSKPEPKQRMSRFDGKVSW